MHDLHELEHWLHTLIIALLQCSNLDIAQLLCDIDMAKRLKGGVRQEMREMQFSDDEYPADKIKAMKTHCHLTLQNQVHQC